jgi:hypothetical protein
VNAFDRGPLHKFLSHAAQRKPQDSSVPCRSMGVSRVLPHDTPLERMTPLVPGQAQP